MKRFFRLLFSFMLLLLFSLSTGHSSAHPVSYSIPDIGIDMLDQQVDNHALSYPIVMISGQYYFPLSWELSKVLGYDAHFSSDRILYLKTRASNYDAKLSSFNFGKVLLSNSATPVTYPVLVDGQPLKSDYPLYNIGGITYLSIGHTHPLIKTSHENTSALPDKYSTLDILDKSLLIRDQGTESTCWAYAANTLFEIA
ncbi:MAG TPA: hypothetical protein DCS67_09820, partial [Clostridiales bacterium UBA8960]|nr:hypothetical protein [Clostridiales bacterium UBA8960]